jgi:PIN like domain
VTEDVAEQRRGLRPSRVRFYFDADVLGLAKLLVQVRNDVTFPGDLGGVLHKRRRPPCPITERGTPDTVWIPEAAAQGWLVITRDINISANRAEIAAVRDSGARMVAAAAGADIIGNDRVELYCSAATVTDLKNRFGLLASGQPNVLLRVPCFSAPELLDRPVMPAPVIAVDLLESRDARSRRAGRQLLEAALVGFAG